MPTDPSRQHQAIANKVAFARFADLGSKCGSSGFSGGILTAAKRAGHHAGQAGWPQNRGRKQQPVGWQELYEFFALAMVCGDASPRVPNPFFGAFSLNPVGRWTGREGVFVSKLSPGEPGRAQKKRRSPRVGMAIANTLIRTVKTTT